MRRQVMKRYLYAVIALIFLLPMSIEAGWQVASSTAVVPREPFFQAGRPGQIRTFVPPPLLRRRVVSVPRAYATMGQPAAVYAVSICGSLKENIERIMGRYHWKVVWKAPFDYNFDGRVSGSSLPNVVDKLLQPFPLQAVMYMSNRTLAIIPRAKNGPRIAGN